MTDTNVLIRPQVSSNDYTKILKLAIPIAGSNLINFMVTFVGVLMLSRLSQEALAASALITAVQTTILVISMGILFSISVIVGHSYGAKKYEEIGGILQQGWLLALLICIPVMVIMWSIKPILIMVGQSPALVNTVQSYFHAYVWGIPAVFIMVCNAQFCLGILRRQIVLINSMCSFLIVTILAYGFIFGKMGLPTLNVAGLGIACAIQAWVILLGFMIYLYFHKNFKPYGVFRWRNFRSFHLLGRLFRVGWPISIQMAGELLSFFVATLMIGLLGALSLGARQISWQYLMIIVMPLFALTQSSSILVGHSMGGERLSEIKQIGDKAIFLGIAFSVLVLFIFISVPKLLISPFVDVHTQANQPLIDLTSALFILMSLGQILDSIRNISTGALRGILDTRFPMIISLICLWGIAIPLGYIMAFTLHQGVVGISIAFNISMLFGAAILWNRWRNKCKVISLAL